MAVVFRAGAQNDASSSSGTITVPASCQVGDVGVLHFSQGNSDVQTSTPTGLTLKDTDTTTASFINKLYVFVVDGTNISASTVLTFSMSATRQWSLSLGTWSGVNTSTPWIDYRKAAATTVPSYTTVEATWPVEVACSKSSGTAITAWTVGTGYTQRAMAGAGGTSGPSSAVADRNAGLAGTGVALGGETYTPNQTATADIRYLVALRPVVNALTQTVTGLAGLTDSGQAAGVGATITGSMGVTDALTAVVPLLSQTVSDTVHVTDNLTFATSNPTGFPTIVTEVDFINDPASTSVNWTDLSPKAWEFSCTRGRSHEQSSIDAGIGSVTWDNRDGTLDPTNASSLFYPRIIPFRRFHLTATWNSVTYPIYTGMVERWPLSWDNTLGSVKSPLTDTFAWLSNKTLRSCYEQEVLADAPVVFYPLTEPTGSTSAGDISGNSQPPLSVGQINDRGDTAFGNATGIPTDGAATLTLNGSLTTAAADATVGDYLFSPAFSWVLPGSVTIEVVITVGATMANAMSQNPTLLAIVAAQHQPSGDTPFGIWLQYNAGAVQLRDQHSFTPIGPDLNDGLLHHLVLVNDAVGTTTTYYVDGVQVAQTPNSFTRNSVQAFTVGGANPYETSSGGSTVYTPFRGGIGYVAGYSAVLPAARVLAHYNAAQTAFPGDTADARIARFLGYAGWTATAALDVCTTTMQAMTGVSGQSALAAIQAVEQAEGGTFFVAKDGTVTYKSRRTRMNTTASAYTFGDGPGELPYEGIAFDFDPTFIFNDVEITRTSAVAVATDPTSQGHYGRRSLNRTVAIQSDPEIADASSWLLQLYKDPHIRVAGLVLNPATNSTLWPACLTLEIGARVTVKRRAPGSPNTIQSDFYVEQITHTTTARQWKTTLALSPVGLQPLIANDAIYGICDSTSVAAW